MHKSPTYAIFLGLIALFFVFVVSFNVGYESRHSPAVMPTRIDVNGTFWEVQIVDGNAGGVPNAVGFTNCAIHRIYLSTASQLPRTVLMHELSHAAVCAGVTQKFTVDNMYYNSSSNEDHEGIYQFSSIWEEILIRNPQLAAYLANLPDSR